MFFTLSKFVWFFAQPSTLMLFALLAGIVMLWSRWARAGRRTVLFSGLLLLITGLSPLGHALILPLEDRFQRADLASGPPDGIVVLGGAQSIPVIAARGIIAVNEAGERILEAATLAREYPQAKILFTGRSSALFGDALSEAEGAAKLLKGLGIAPERLILEGESRNTWQNAVFSRKLVQPLPGERWLLVTSAGHMPRAMGSFRKAGFAVKSWPVDYRTRGRQDLTSFFSRPSEGWRRVDLAAREWAGLLAYRVTGRTGALFPGPE